MEIKAGNHQTAKQLVSQGLRRNPSHAALWTIAGLVEEKVGNTARARKILTKAISLFPE
jgi:Flp pilus assembly protein TadD